MNEQPAVARTSARGSIYDLGYRHYDGRRLGRRYADWSLYVESLRGLFGFGRPARAKAVPFGLLVLYAAPALLQLAFTALIKERLSQAGTSLNELNLFGFANYFERMWFVPVLFCIAQAPDLLSRDQRHHVLPLYFTRAVRRMDYAVAKLAAMATAIAILMVVPVVLLVFGAALLEEDLFKGIGDQLWAIPPSAATIALISIGLASLSLALSAFSPRRAYSAIGVAAYFLVVQTVATIIYEVGRQADWAWVNVMLLIRPVGSMIDATQFFFGPPPPAPFSGFVPPNPNGPEMYFAAVIAMAVVATAVLLLRYRRIEA